MKREIKVGDDVVIGKLEDDKHNFLYRDYIARVQKIQAGYAFVDTEPTGIFQSVTFKVWLPIDKLTLVPPAATEGGRRNDVS